MLFLAWMNWVIFDDVLSV